MKELLDEIRSGAFATEWISEAKAGYPRFEAERARDRALTIEDVGGRLRAMMPWLKTAGRAPEVDSDA
jgi:ketol-acid reductoisomerase